MAAMELTADLTTPATACAALTVSRAACFVTFCAFSAFLRTICRWSFCAAVRFACCAAVTVFLWSCRPAAARSFRAKAGFDGALPPEIRGRAALPSAFLGFSAKQDGVCGISAPDFVR